MAEQQPETRTQEFTTHMKRAGQSVIRQWGSLIPKEFWTYGRDATREMLLAMRAVVNGAIDVIDPESEVVVKPVTPKSKLRSKKKIDIEG
jgi:hypothetical protein